MWVEQAVATQQGPEAIIQFAHKSSCIVKIMGDGSHVSTSSYIFEVWEDSNQAKSDTNGDQDCDADGVLIGIARIPLSGMALQEPSIQYISQRLMFVTYLLHFQ